MHDSRHLETVETVTGEVYQTRKTYWRLEIPYLLGLDHCADVQDVQDVLGAFGGDICVDWINLPVIKLILSKICARYSATSF